MKFVDNVFYDSEVFVAVYFIFRNHVFFCVPQMNLPENSSPKEKADDMDILLFTTNKLMNDVQKTRHVRFTFSAWRSTFEKLSFRSHCFLFLLRMA